MHHVGIDVADLGGAIQFYSAALGVKVAYEFGLPDMAIKGVFLTHPAGWTIELFHRAGAKPHGRSADPLEAHDTLGIGHFCLSTSDIQASFAQMLAAGATARIDPVLSPNPAHRVAYVSDSEGNLIELITDEADG